MSGTMDKERRAARRRDRLGRDLTALSAGALGLCLLLVAGLLGLLAEEGLGFFWPRPVERFALKDGTAALGEAVAREAIPGEKSRFRVQIKRGDRDFDGADFVWIDEDQIVSRTRPAEAVLLERSEWGPFYGRVTELRSGAATIAEGQDAVLAAFPALWREKKRAAAELRSLERGPVGAINAEIERLNLSRRAPALARLAPAERDRRLRDIDAKIAARKGEYERLAERLAAQRAELNKETLVLKAEGGATKEMPVANVVRLVRPNALTFGGKLGLYGSRLREFVAGEPRESNTEGGIFPALFGTVMMVFLMTFVVSPLGALAAVYLREYAKQGPLVRAVRIAVNNLAGVPSIVFGMFGLGFFVYIVGGTIDKLFYPEALPSPTFGTGGILWAALTLALLTVPVVIVAAEEGLAAVPRAVREGSLALGATKFETTWRIVVPAAAPGILTGMILAMARAAGEVAPLMIVGMVKLAPRLPVDGSFPYVHLERKFMHLGFHIYDVGFQSPNVDATKPLVFATALLLVLVVAAMNLLAIGLRNHLRAKYTSSAV